jgi:hypothetical protein
MGVIKVPRPHSQATNGTDRSLVVPRMNRSILAEVLPSAVVRMARRYLGKNDGDEYPIPLSGWYPNRLMVGPEGTPGTYSFMQTAFAPGQAFHYAEFGIYRADTALRIADLFPHATLHLFDFEDTIEVARRKLARVGDRIAFYPNSQRYNDSYNWALIKLIKSQNGTPLLDYCFLDGAHTVAIDALNFFLCDRLLKVGGYIDFDDYDWRIRGSSVDPAKVPKIAEQYTDEQIDAFQVKMIVDELVRRDVRYKEVVKEKIFQKTAA